MSEGVLPLRIYCLGHFRVFRGDFEIADGQWYSRKAQAVFKYLLVQRGRPTPKEVLIEVIWPDLDIDRAEARFYKAVSRLYRILEPDALPRRSRYIQAHHGAYAAAPDAIAFVDSEEFLKKVQAGDVADRLGNRQEAQQRYLEAERLYVGDFLEADLYEEWVVAERERLRNQNLKVLGKLARLTFEERTFPQSIEYCERRLARDRYSCEATLLLMKNLAELDEIPRALQVFQNYQELLRQDLGEAPAPSVMRLHDEIVGKTRVPR